jgi:small-conductance mechanosensitive channel
MIDLHVGDVNYLAVLVAALAAFLLGGLWYTALFGRKWRELQGITEEKVKEMQARRPPAAFFGGMMASYLILALAMAWLFGGLGIDSAASGMIAGLLIWLGPAAAIGMTGHLASDKPIGVYAIDTSFQLLYLIGMGAILGGWR